MKNISMKSISVIAIATLVLTGCMSAPKSFLEPSIPKVSYEQVKRSVEPPRLKISSEFKRNGESRPTADKVLYENTERVLRGSGAILPSNNGEDGTFHIEVNNLVDHGPAIARGIGNGLTLGFIGNTITDDYIINIIVIKNGKKIERSGIQHKLHTTIGNSSPPEGIEYSSIPRAFDKMVEQVILNTLIEMQKSGELSMSSDHLMKITMALS